MTYAKLHAVGAIHELPLSETQGLGYFLRKSWYPSIDKASVHSYT
ncbi:MAG: hypothetical protein V7K38_28015 [Nostoc sp.]